MVYQKLIDHRNKEFKTVSNVWNLLMMDFLAFHGLHLMRDPEIPFEMTSPVLLFRAA